MFALRLYDINETSIFITVFAVNMVVEPWSIEL